MCSLVKYGLFAVNLIFALAGLALLGVGIAVLLQLADFSELVDAAYVDSIPVVTIVLGVLTFLIAFFGCCGAIKENGCLLVTYGIFMLVLASGKIYISVVTFTNWNNIYDAVTDWLTEAFRDTTVRENYHGLERTFSCCGTVGYQSYLPEPIPASCCPENLTSCTPGDTFDGCIQVISSFLETYAEVIGIVAIVVIVVEVMAMFLSFCLCRNVSQKE
ncbi:unnamed protein product, partial [Brenthis ino]